MSVEPSWPKHLPKTQTSNTIVLSTKLPNTLILGYTIQTIAVLKLLWEVSVDTIPNMNKNANIKNKHLPYLYLTSTLTISSVEPNLVVEQRS
jgi:hypothetical protein